MYLRSRGKKATHFKTSVLKAIIPTITPGDLSIDEKVRILDKHLGNNNNKEYRVCCFIAQKIKDKLLANEKEEEETKRKREEQRKQQQTPQPRRSLRTQGLPPEQYFLLSDVVEDDDKEEEQQQQDEESPTKKSRVGKKTKLPDSILSSRGDKKKQFKYLCYRNRTRRIQDITLVGFIIRTLSPWQFE